MPVTHDRSYPLVSVVLPAFNAALTLAQTLDSIIAQTYPSIEIIVVDDGSTDETAEILRKYADRLRSVYQPNRGLSSARNVGCRLARGQFIALMDSDDLCMPERVAVQLQTLLRHPEAGLCCSDFSAFDGKGQVFESYEATYYSQIGDAPVGIKSLFAREEKLEVTLALSAMSHEAVDIDVHFGTVYPNLAFGNFVHPPTVMFRSGILQDVGMFDEMIRYNSDWECFVRMARIAPFVHVARPLLRYRLSASQMSSSQGNRGKGAADLIYASEKIWRSDPGLMVAAGDRIRHCRRDFYANAARSLAEHDKLLATRMLAGSLRYGGLSTESINTAFKIVLPDRLVALVRQHRSLARNR